MSRIKRNIPSVVHENGNLIDDALPAIIELGRKQLVRDMLAGETQSFTVRPISELMCIIDEYDNELTTIDDVINGLMRKIRTLETVNEDLENRLIALEKANQKNTDTSSAEDK